MNPSNQRLGLHGSHSCPTEKHDIMGLCVPMEKKKTFEPGDMVTTFTGQAGVVVAEEVYVKIRDRVEQGKRPGHYFAPGCCQHPDYITQIPVLFEDGKYDVMRPMNIRKSMALPIEKKRLIQSIIDEQS